MALESRHYSTRLQIQFDLGLDEDGRRLTASKSFSNIRAESSDQEIYDTAIGLTALQSNPVIVYRKVTQTDLVDVQD
ncbi:MAG: DUF1659 domain-containing protein [Caldicoprobacterales bacterium]|jgi:hypothetical protein|nr:DUF1659 domain-containing protein [Clostridiales bacterium]